MNWKFILKLSIYIEIVYGDVTQIIILGYVQEIYTYWENSHKTIVTGSILIV